MDSCCRLQVLLDRLAAQELMLLQRPVISGRYSASPFINMLSGPLDEALRPMFAQLVHLGELVCCLLSEESRSHADQLAQVDSVLHSIEAQRYAFKPYVVKSNWLKWTLFLEV